MIQAPGFWWTPPGAASRLLAPASTLYGAVAGHRMRNAPRAAAPLPLVCVGNFTLGGAGKTPTALALGQAALERGLRPGFVTRGHGGARTGTGAFLVDPARDTARETGDEAMLLAALAPCAAGRDRAAGARLLHETGCDLAIMDDGFQSARLGFDLALIVVDGRRGVGNGQVFPAGPLRARLQLQARYADALVVIGDGVGARDVAALRPDLPAWKADLVADDGAAFAGRSVLAFAGIGDPEKFRRSLEQAGAEVAAFRDFPDHHPFTETDAQALLEQARRAGLTLATTAKDRVRLLGGGAAARELAETARVLHVHLRFRDPGAADGLIDAALSRRFARASPANTGSPEML